MFILFIFNKDAPNGIAPLKSDWYQASNPLKMLIFMKICSFYENVEIFIQVHQTGASYLLKLLIFLKIWSFDGNM